MVRLFFGLLAFAAAVAGPALSWAEDEKSDSEIARSIVTALQEKKERGQLREFHVDVSVAHGDVWLKGDVATPEQQKMVLEIARHTPGVLQVVNDLTVISPDGTPQPVKKPTFEDKPRPDIKWQQGAQRQQFRRPVPNGKPQVAKIPQPGVMPASANSGVPAVFSPTWQPRGKRIADQIVQSIDSKREAGELKGFDVVVHVRLGNTVYLHGKIANEKTRSALLKTVRSHPEITDVHDLTKLAEAETDLPDKVISDASNVPSFHARQKLSWDDGWWELDLKEKKHR